jgi:phage shock protein PspC (stress-responsive transcriptional regulator)
MKKTISVNIKGLNFIIEEDAYETLQNYLKRLEAALQSVESAKEIIEDVELRIAELCSEVIATRKQVIEEDDIRSILNKLGEPEQFIEEQEHTEAQQQTEERSEKRIFRDTDKGMIAGVCAGIASYTNLDIVIIRAIFVAFLIFGGFGVPLYFVLWIIIPRAASTIDKLRMQGKPITVESLREEVEQAADRITKTSKRFAHKIEREERLANSFKSIGRLFSVLIGSGFLVLGLISLVLFLTFILGGFQFIPVQSDFGFLSIGQLAELVMENDTDIKYAWIGILLAGIPGTLFLLLSGIKLIFQIRNVWSRISLISLFTLSSLGFVTCLILGLKTGRNMTIEGEIEKHVATIDSKELNIDTSVPSEIDQSVYTIKSKNRFGLMSLEGNQIYSSGIEVEYRNSKDSLFHIYQNLSAHSHSHNMAIQKAKNIKHTVTQSENTIAIHSHYFFPKTDKLRDQEVSIIIEVPAQGIVKYNNLVLFQNGIGVLNEYDQWGKINREGNYKHFQ